MCYNEAIKPCERRINLMKHTSPALRRVTAGLLALLLGASAALTGCVGGGKPADTTSAEEGTNATTATGETEELLTLGEPETGAPSGTDTPVSDYEPPETLIGDGSEAAGVYPVFSAYGGIYTEEQKSVEITAPEGYTVRYTTDGSVPTKRSTVCDAPIKLTADKGEGTVIRAACFDANDKLTGQVVTQTYVRGDAPAGLTYTVMLTCDEEDLQAMYANVQAKVERAAHAEILAPDGTRIISQDVGLRLFGGSSRSLAQKSFKIIARKNGYFGDEPYVGTGNFYYPFFGERTVLAGRDAGKVLDTYDSLILRNGGNDSLLSTAEDGEYATLLRDGICNEFIARYAPNVAASYAHFAVVYLNGEYYGILELRENQNEDYVKRLWGLDDQQVVVVKSELDTTRACGEHSNGGSCRFCGSWFFYETDEDAAAQAELDAWISLCRRAAAAVDADEDTYRKVFAEVSAALDLENAKEYLAVACYFCNTDWPHNNVRVWRYTGDAVEGVTVSDGKWRFATRDMDMAMGRYATPSPLPELDNSPEVDMFRWVLESYVDGYRSEQPYADALYLQGLFAFLMRDDAFRTDFAAYCREIASEEATAYLLALYQDAYEQVNPIISDHINRWKRQVPSNFDIRRWRRAAARVESFIEDRSARYLSHLETLLAMYE